MKIKKLLFMLGILLFICKENVLAAEIYSDGKNNYSSIDDAISANADKETITLSLLDYAKISLIPDDSPSIILDLNGKNLNLCDSEINGNLQLINSASQKSDINVENVNNSGTLIIGDNSSNIYINASLYFSNYAKPHQTSDSMNAFKNTGILKIQDATINAGANADAWYLCGLVYNFIKNDGGKVDLNNITVNGSRTLSAKKSGVKTKLWYSFIVSNGGEVCINECNYNLAQANATEKSIKEIIFDKTKTSINEFFMDSYNGIISISNSDDVCIKNSILKTFSDPIKLTNNICYIDSSIIYTESGDCILNEGILNIGSSEESTTENMVIKSDYDYAINNKSGDLKVERGTFMGYSASIYDESTDNISVGTLDEDNMGDASVRIVAGSKNMSGNVFGIYKPNGGRVSILSGLIAVYSKDVDWNGNFEEMFKYEKVGVYAPCSVINIGDSSVEYSMLHMRPTIASKEIAIYGKDIYMYSGLLYSDCTEAAIIRYDNFYTYNNVYLRTRKNEDESSEYAFYANLVPYDYDEHDLHLTEFLQQNATCTEKGNIHYWECDVCHNKYSDEKAKTEIEDVVIPATGHKEVIDEAVVATCMTAGRTEGSHCSECRKVIKKQEEIPATGHKWDNGVVTKEPTTVTEGEKTYTCTVCKTTKKEVIPKLTEDTSIKNNDTDKNIQTIKATTSKTFTTKNVKKKAQSFKLSAKSSSGNKVKYKLIKSNKKIKFEASSGKITVKKGTKKGTYKIKVKMTVAGNDKYNDYSVTKTITIKVK